MTDAVPADAPSAPPVEFLRLGERTSLWLGDLGRHEQTNMGVIEDESELVVVDANFGWAAERVLAAIDEGFAKPVRHVVNTHYHVDHSLGNEVFARAGATVVGARGQRRELLDKGPADAVIQVGAPPERFEPASLEFDGTIVFPASGLELIAIPPAHTGSDVLAWIPGDGVLFVGDLAVAWDHGNNFSDDDADLDGWLAALARCLALHPTTVVPAHGRIGGPEILVQQRDFLQELWDRSRTAVAAGRTAFDDGELAAIVARHPDFAVDVPRLTEMAGSTLEAARRATS